MTTLSSSRVANGFAADASSLHPGPEDHAGGICLVELAAHRPTTIIGLAAGNGEAGSAVRLRLAELGFMAGESICVLQRGPGGREPIAVQVGDTVFALRRHEAGFIQVRAPQ